MTTEYKELPVYSWTDFDRVDLVKLSLRELESSGNFRSCSALVDMMGRDIKFVAAFEQRFKGLLSLPRKVAPNGKSKRAQDAAKMVEEHWDWMFPDDTVVEFLKWKVTLGLALGELVWEYEDGLLLPRLKVWNPHHVFWRMDTRQFYVNTEGGGQIQITPNDGQWVLSTPRGIQRGWMSGLVRPLALPWLLRQWTYRDWARWNEIHGIPITKAYVPVGSSAESKTAFVREVAGIGSNSVIKLPRSMSKEQDFDIELEEATSRSWEGFQATVQEIGTDIEMLVLGQNLTSRVEGGSRAAAQVHESVRNDILKSDAKTLMSVFREQILTWVFIKNYGTKDIVPKPSLHTDPPEDKKAAAEAKQITGLAVTSLRAAGIQVDADKMMEEAGIPTTGPSKVIEPQPVPTNIPGNNPMDNGKNVSKAKTSTDANKGSNKGYVKGQVRADEIVDNFRDAAKLMIEPDVKTFLDIVANGKDYESIRKGIVQAYGEMDPSILSNLVEKAILLAELDGMLSVQEDL